MNRYMFMRILYLLFTSPFCVLSLNAQISTLDNNPRNNVVQVSNKVVYDSLTNIHFLFNKHDPITNYKYSEGRYIDNNLSHLIGQRLYFYGDTVEMAKTSWLHFYKNKRGKKIYYSYKDFLNKYFTLVGVSIKEHEFYIFKLIPENDTDTLYCRMNYFLRNDFWTVEGYYVKAKNDFLYKQFVLVEPYNNFKKENWLYRLEDNLCISEIPCYSVWECTDVTLKGYNNKEDYSIVVLVFTNKDLGNYYIYLDNRIRGRNAIRDRHTLDLFKPKEEYDKELMELKSKHDSIIGNSFMYLNEYKYKSVYSLSNHQKYNEIADNTEFTCTSITFLNNNVNQMIYILHNDKYGDVYTFENDFARVFKSKEELLRVKQNEEQRRKLIIAKYGQRNGLLILEGKVRIGFSKAMCEEAWGKPQDINRSTGSWGVHEQWCYSDGSYLYFENGKLTSIQN